MVSLSMRSVIRLISILGLAGLMLLPAAVVVQAVSAQAPEVGLLYQEPGYPTPEDGTPVPIGDDGYPAPPSQEITGTQAQPVLPQGTPTETLTPTPPVDVFATENAEMGDTLSTPPAAGTEIPTQTPVPTITSQPQETASPEPTAVAAVAQGGFEMDWGLFAIGFAIPVLAGCGAVLYYLDRRPDLFSRRPRG